MADASLGTVDVRPSADDRILRRHCCSSNPHDSLSHRPGYPRPPAAVDLLSFAMLTWVLAPLNIKAKLVSHFVTDASGRYMLNAYTGKNREQWEQPGSSSSSGSSSSGGAQLPAAAAGMLALQQLVQAAAERAV